MKVKSIVTSSAPKLVNGTLPDIDTDFSSKGRQKIKSYIEERFGISQVCSVGVTTTFQLKGLVKDLARFASIDFSEANIVSSMIDGYWDKTLLDLIKRSTTEPKLKQFIKENSDLIFSLPSLLNQPKTQSVHPCAMIIFPSVMSSGEWAPIRTQQGITVSEWSGYEMDDAGFLKGDILGIKQLDKFSDTLDLIRKNGKEVPDLDNLPLDDSEVYRYFGNGWNGDVFQFGSAGLVEYTKRLKPEVIGDLIATVAIFRPGPMDNGYHEDYVKCKNQGVIPKYLWGTETITSETFGILVYQEQIMQVCQFVGGLTMKEADDVRRAMGKQKRSEILRWEEKISSNFMAKGATREEFQEVWDSMLKFARYSFNKSHAACYALTGYNSQYLKVKYPIEYWTVALSYSSESDVSNYLSEILQAGVISVSPPDINSSELDMTSDQDSSTIFWGIGSIKGIGEDTALQIINERNKNGKYMSFADFFFRHSYTGSKVKKQTFEALVASGAFDALYQLSGKEERRMLLVSRYRKFKKVKVSNPLRDPYTIGETTKNWWWKKQQKALTGLAHIDYRKIAEEEEIGGKFCSTSEFNSRQNSDIFRTYGGYIVECKIGKSAKGKYARLTIENNYKLFKLLIWSDEFKKFEKELTNCEKSLIIFSGNIRYDEKWARANQFTLKANSELIVL